MTSPYVKFATSRGVALCPRSNAFLSNDLEGALAAWEQAAAIDPEHATLQVNLGVVRRKLGRG